MKFKSARACYPSAKEGAAASRSFTVSPQTQSESYKLAFADEEFLLKGELRGIRLQLEMMKPEMILHDHNIESTIVMFGGTRVPEEKIALERLQNAQKEAKEDPQNVFLQKRVVAAERILQKSHYYEEARKLARIITEQCRDNNCNMVIATGGGPGIMEAANRGAHDSNGKSIGFNIVLPSEQSPNQYITPDLCFQFHYFAIRKMHFLLRAKALVIFPGGFGTLDEFFETLTMIQTKKMKPLPVILFGKEFWDEAINFNFFLEEGLIGPYDLEIFQYVETAEQAWKIIAEFYQETFNSSP